MPGMAQKTDTLSLLSLRNELAAVTCFHIVDASVGVDRRGYSVGEMLLPFAGFFCALLLFKYVQSAVFTVPKV